MNHGEEKIDKVVHRLDPLYFHALSIQSICWIDSFLFFPLGVICSKSVLPVLGVY